MLCATTSCSSRAIRKRSCATALLAASSCSRTAYRRRWRTLYPLVHAMITQSTTGISALPLKRPPLPDISTMATATRVRYTATRTRTASRLVS